MKETFMKTGARVILMSMLTPLLIWGGTSIVHHGKEIVKLKAHMDNTKELVIELRDDIRFIRHYIINKGK